jgi:hypothetical protein
MAERDYDREMAEIERLGWDESRVSTMDKCDRNWFRKFLWEPKDQHNIEKPLQVQLQLWDHRQHGHLWGYQVHLVGQPLGGIGCVEFMAYSISDVAMIEPNVERLLKAWRAVQEVTP